MAGGVDRVTVNLLFDSGSLYSWFCLEVILRYKERWGLRLILRPILLGAVMRATGNSMPTLVPARGKWVMQDTKRNAQYMQVPYTSTPASFGPSFNSMYCQRVLTAVAMVKGNESQELVSLTLSLYKAIWGAKNGEEVDITNKAFLWKCCLNAGFSEEDATEYLRKAEDNSVKEQLKYTTTVAVEKGTFGAPTMFVYLKGQTDVESQWEKEPYDCMVFGSDRFEQLAFFLGKRWDGPLPSIPSAL